MAVLILCFIDHLLCINQLLLIVGLKYTLRCIYCKFPKICPLPANAFPLLKPQVFYPRVNERECSGHAFMRFSSALSLFGFKNTYTLNTCTIALFAGHRQGLCCLHQEREFTQGSFLSPLTMDVALIYLE